MRFSLAALLQYIVIAFISILAFVEGNSCLLLISQELTALCNWFGPKASISNT